MFTYLQVLWEFLVPKFKAITLVVLGNCTFSKATAKAPSKSSHSFDWTIENFGTRFIRHGTGVRKAVSPTFQVKHPDGISTTSWQVEIEVVDGRTIEAYLELLSCPKKYLEGGHGLLTTFNLWFGTFFIARSYGFKATHEYKETETSWGWPEFIHVPCLRWNWLLPQDCLRVRVDVTIFAPPDPSSLSPGVGNESLNAAASSGIVVDEEKARAALDFKLNFEFLLENKNFSDITIQCGSRGKTFHAHKNILAARSEVFKAMLESGMEEVQSGVINVTDITGTAFGILLRYMYTGKVDPALDSDCLIQIIYGAEKYGLKELKDYCFAKLANGLCEENLGELAVAAHLYGAEDEIRNAIRKFMEPKFFKLMNKKGFRRLVEKHGQAFFI